MMNDMKTYLLRFAEAGSAFAFALPLDGTISMSESESSSTAGFFRLDGGIGFFSSTSESGLTFVWAFFADAFFVAGLT